MKNETDYYRVTCILCKSGLRGDGTYILPEEIRKMAQSMVGKDFRSEKGAVIGKVVEAKVIDLTNREIGIEGTIHIEKDNVLGR